MAANQWRPEIERLRKRHHFEREERARARFETGHPADSGGPQQQKTCEQRLNHRAEKRLRHQSIAWPPQRLSLRAATALRGKQETTRAPTGRAARAKDLSTDDTPILSLRKICR